MANSRTASPQTKNNIKIILSDDSILIRDACKALLTSSNCFEIVEECAGFHDTVNAVKKNIAHLVIIHVNGDMQSWLDNFVSSHPANSRLKIILLSKHLHPVFVKNALRSGVHGFISHQTPGEEFIAAIKTVFGGKKYLCNNLVNEMSKLLLGDEINGFNTLSQRELEIAELVKSGLSSKDIAEKIGISAKTVEVHRHNILRKMGVNSTPMLISLMNGDCYNTVASV